MAVRIVVKAPDIAKAKLKMRRYRAAVDRGMRAGMTDTIISIQGRAKKTFGSPGHLHRDTGRLMRAIVTQPLKVLKEYIRGTVGVLATVAYGRIHEEGGRINHPGSRPRKRKALAWASGGLTRLGQAVSYSMGETRKQAFALGTWSKGKFTRGEFVEGGDITFAMYTRPHPIDIPARPYLRPSLQAEVPRMQDTFRSRIARALGEEG